MDVTLGPARKPAVEELDVEVVERKGRGHPDTMCDGLVENLSLALSRHYFERFGTVLHHNVDKALLVGGTSQPKFGGGRVVRPMELLLAGRATLECAGEVVPLDELAVEVSRTWLRANLRELDVDRHIVVDPKFRPGSVDLVELFGRGERSGPVAANDTSIGVGYAPLSDLERIVLRAEEALNSPGTKERHPEIGEDVKILGLRRGNRISLVIATAFVDRFLSDATAYLEGREHVAAVVREAASEFAGAEVDVTVNAADDPAAERFYLTVTGTSAEAGDDGQAGRGNRWNGLITPYRPMVLESVAGKNPVSHVGKLYQIAAQRLAEALVTEIDGVQGAECVLTSRIGRPITDPEVADVKLRMLPRRGVSGLRDDVHALAKREMSRIENAWIEALEGQLGTGR